MTAQDFKALVRRTWDIPCPDSTSERGYPNWADYWERHVRLAQLVDLRDGLECSKSRTRGYWELRVTTSRIGGLGWLRIFLILVLPFCDGCCQKLRLGSNSVTELMVQPVDIATLLYILLIFVSSVPLACIHTSAVDYIQTVGIDHELQEF